MYDTGGDIVLREISPWKPMPSIRVVPDNKEVAALAMAFDCPPFSELLISNELRKKAVYISASGSAVCGDVMTARLFPIGSNRLGLMGRGWHRPDRGADERRRWQ